MWKFLRSIWKAVLALLGHRAETGGAAVRLVTFANETSGVIEVRRQPPDGEGGQSIVTLKRGAALEQETWVGASWSAIDVRSGFEVATWSITDGDRRLVVDNSDLGTPRQGGVAMGEVELTFRNGTHLDLELRSLDGDRTAQTTSCPAGHARTVGTQSGEVWAAVTVASDAPGRGFVPAGIELGRFVAGTGERLVYDIENTMIGFENQTLLDVEVVEIDAGGQANRVATLRPMEYTYLPNWLALTWEVVDERSRARLVHLSPIREPRLVEVRSALAPPAGDGPPQQVTIENTTALTLLVEHFDVERRWQPRGMLAPAASVAVDATGSGTLRARERRTGDVIAMTILEHDTNGWQIAIPAASSSLASDVEVANETHLHLDVVDGASGASLASLAPHQTFSTRLIIGQRFLARDRPSGAVVATGIAQRLQPVMRPTSAKLRSASGGAPAELTVENGLGQPVDVIELDELGGVASRITSPPSATEPIASAADRVVRVVRAGSGEIVRELIAVGGAQTVDLRVPSSPDGPATSLTLVNATLLDLDVYYVAAGGDGETVIEDLREFLDRGATKELDTHAGASYVIRDRHSGNLVDGAIARRSPRTVEIRSNHLRSAPQPAPRPIRIDNDSGLDVIVVAAPSWEPSTIDVELATVLTPGGRAWYPGALYRAVAPALGGAVVAERIASRDDTTWTVTADLMRTVAGASAPLHDGEVAFYDAADVDRGVVIRQDIRDLGALPGFPGRVGAIRVGPNTAAAITPAGASAATTVTMDLPSLDGTSLAGRLTGCAIERVASESELGITHRCDLTKDYDADGNEVTSYRTTITVPPAVTDVEIWTEGVVRSADGRPTSPGTTLRWIEESGTIHNLPIAHDTSQRLQPNSLGKITFSIAATNLAAPALLFRTNTMGHGDLLTIRPDAVGFQRVADLPEHAIYERFGQASGLERDQCGHIQTAMQNIARTVCHRTVPTAHGFDHVHGIVPDRMSHPHWRLDLDHAVYSPVDGDVAAELVARAAPPTDPLTTSVWGIIDHGWDQVKGISAHAVAKASADASRGWDAARTDWDNTVARLRHDGDRMDANMQAALRSGNVGGALQAAGSGLLSFGVDGVTGLLHSGGDLVGGGTKALGDLGEGAEHAFVVTVQTEQQIVGYVITHPQAAEEFLVGLAARARIAWDEFVAWLRSEFDDSVLSRTTDAIKDLFHTAPATLGHLVDEAEEAIHAEFQQLHHRVEQTFDQLRGGLDAASHRRYAPDRAHQQAAETLDWVLSHLMAASPLPGTSFGMPDPPPVSVDPASANVPASFLDTGEHFRRILSDAIVDPGAAVPDIVDLIDDSIHELLNLIEGAIDGVLDTTRTVVDALCRLHVPIEIPVLSTVFDIHTASDASALVLAVPTSIALGASGVDDLRAAIADLPTDDTVLPALTSVQSAWGLVEVACGLVNGVLQMAGARPKRKERLIWQLSRLSELGALIAGGPEWLWTNAPETEQGSEPWTDRAAVDFPLSTGDFMWFLQCAFFVLDMAGDGLVAGGKAALWGVPGVSQGLTAFKAAVEAVFAGVIAVSGLVLYVSELHKVGYLTDYIASVPTEETDWTASDWYAAHYKTWGVGGATVKLFQGLLAAVPGLLSIVVVNKIRSGVTDAALAEEEVPLALLSGGATLASTAILDLRLLGRAMY